MNIQKISLTLPGDLVAEARGYAPGGNLSAYVAEGLRQRVRADRLARYLRELDAESGSLGAEELEAVRHEWHSEG